MKGSVIVDSPRAFILVQPQIRVVVLVLQSTGLLARIVTRT